MNCAKDVQNFCKISTRSAQRFGGHFIIIISYTHQPQCTVVGNDLLDGQWQFRNFGCIQVSVNCESTKLFETSTGMSESTKLFETNIGMIWFFRNVPLFKAKLRGFHDSIKYAPLPQNISSMQCHIVRRSFAGSYIDYASKCYL